MPLMEYEGAVATLQAPANRIELASAERSFVKVERVSPLQPLIEDTLGPLGNGEIYEQPGTVSSQNCKS